METNVARYGIDTMPYSALMILLTNPPAYYLVEVLAVAIMRRFPVQHAVRGYY
jgi:hypothetical protein